MMSDLIKVNGYNPFKTLLLREYWENRRAILITPLVIAGLMIFLLLVTLTFKGTIHMNGAVLTLSDLMDDFSDHDAEQMREGIHLFMMVSATPIWIGVWFCMVFTALSSLYDERKDNSILFWKSMPISDTQTILSKLITIMLITPLVALIVASAFQIFLLIIGTFIFLLSDHSVWSLVWGPANLPLLVVNEMVVFVMYALWALPVFAWFMFASAIAKRTPLLVATIPMVLASVFEKIFLGSQYIATFFVNHIGLQRVIGNQFNDNLDDIPHLDTLAVIKTGADPEMWFGLALAAALLYGTILLRRRSNL